VRKLTHEEIVARQTKKMREPFLPVTVILNNIRSLYNVGSIFRTADGVGVEKIWLCGLTGYPPQSQISKTALGAEDRIPWDYRQDVLPLVHQLKAQGYQLILLEQMDKSTPYWDFQPQPPTCLIVGNEIEGVSEELIGLCDGAVDIDMAGLKNSLNVAVAFGIVVYHIRRCLKKNRNN
jgi:tRNA G18 (ribose-2'-O)-methylase SpoU